MDNVYRPTEENKISDRIHKTSIPGLYFIDTPLASDERGFFREVAILPGLQQILPFDFQIKQINHARSEMNVIRGMHAEDWNKLVTVAHGTALCVLSDIRPDSETFLKSEYFLLGFSETAAPGSLFITKGIANSVCAIDAPVEYLYFVDELYKERNTSKDTAISIFDPDLNIKWPIQKEKIIISERDKNSITLRDLLPEKFQ